jgi:hypothetical protein
MAAEGDDRGARLWVVPTDGTDASPAITFFRVNGFSSL